MKDRQTMVDGLILIAMGTCGTVTIVTLLVGVVKLVSTIGAALACDI